MAFGQQSGPPASAKQVAYLASLLKDAGHDSFRDARYPLGLTQRQAGGKFTKNEASELIDSLLSGDAALSVDERAERDVDRVAREVDEERASIVGGLPADVLVAELERRGWSCIAPT